MNHVSIVLWLAQFTNVTNSPFLYSAYEK